MKNNNVVIGKFTLESLTTGMYADPMIIYREYMQNSTDAIDKAVSLGILPSVDHGKIEIDVNSAARQIIITDNGCGVSEEDSWNTLCDIGNSKKSHLSERGFRGIGRLGGLSYCNKLIFETTSKGEDVKTIITWDCNKLRSLIKPGENNDLDLIKVIEQVATIGSKSEKSDEHYFKVILSEVCMDNDILIDEDHVRDYLSQVAPIPFNAIKFPYYNDKQEGIKQKIKDLGLALEEYNIHLNKDPNPLYKPYKTQFALRKKKDSTDFDKIYGIEYIIERDEHDNLLFWGWYALTGLHGTVGDRLVAGLRLRKRNILIGDYKTLDDFFSQSRFNNWFIGEIHICGLDLIPTARRDDFEKDTEYSLFKSLLETHTKGDLSKKPHSYSAFNAAVRGIDKAHEVITEISGQIGNISNPTKQKQLYEKLDKARKAIDDNENELSKIQHKIDQKHLDEVDRTRNKAKELKKESVKIENDIIDSEYRNDIQKALSKYPRETRKIITRIFEVLDSELENMQSESLQRKILDMLNKKK